MAKDVGARKVIFASCAPPIRHSNVYGIDMPSRAELVAYGRAPADVATAIGADLVIFQTLADLVASVRQFNPAIEAFETSVFTGEYVTGGVDEAYLSSLEAARADNVKGRLELGGLGTMEGKGGGAVDHLAGAKRRGVQESMEVPTGCSGPMNGADSTVGLHNTYNMS